MRSKPTVHVKVTGPQGSGKTRIATVIVEAIAKSGIELEEVTFEEEQTERAPAQHLN